MNERLEAVPRAVEVKVERAGEKKG